ncbi:hypothetical protein EVAR_51647_1 [Eumeta japonica]|uniref:Uncharacterized protein n=1 Tax=Eumeta variegata TaxID=151549 RepID=A0A4C1YDY3_EUMVA|nr:hypothetical protein EVAR_51647_1 [Eumeta japonica]
MRRGRQSTVTARSSPSDSKNRLYFRRGYVPVLWSDYTEWALKSLRCHRPNFAVSSFFEVSFYPGNELVPLSRDDGGSARGGERGALERSQF